MREMEDKNNVKSNKTFYTGKELLQLQWKIWINSNKFNLIKGAVESNSCHTCPDLEEIRITADQSSSSSRLDSKQNFRALWTNSGIVF